MKKVIREIGKWILSISGAESINAMSLRLKQFASKHKETYTCVRVEKYSNRTVYSVYINNSSYYQGESFDEAFEKLKESFSKKDVKQKDTLI